MAGRHAGKLLWPELVTTFTGAAPEILRDLDETTWDRVIAAEPSPRPPLTEEELDAVLEVVADIADLKSPWFSGHSRGVADLAGRAVRAAGLPERDVVTTRRAGLVHDIGRTAIANTVWDRREPLTDGDRERVRLHAYYTERMLRRPVALAGLAAIASSHRERLAGAAVDVVLGVSGHRRSGPPAAPAGLTPREVEVLVLVARGATTRHVARTLHITPKTAGNHIERIYAKIGASSRSTATWFALQHGMLATLEPVQR
jgi:DNA-binding CsgD family transcriptional regulator